MATPGHDVTGLLQAWGGGDPAALDQLVPIVYDELHRHAQLVALDDALNRYGALLAQARAGRGRRLRRR